MGTEVVILPPPVPVAQRENSIESPILWRGPELNWLSQGYEACVLPFDLPATLYPLAEYQKHIPAKTKIANTTHNTNLVLGFI